MLVRKGQERQQGFQRPFGIRPSQGWTIDWQGSKEGQVLEGANDGDQEILRGEVLADLPCLRGLLEDVHQVGAGLANEASNRGSSLFRQGLGELVGEDEAATPRVSPQHLRSCQEG